jgi:hypothetical protein
MFHETPELSHISDFPIAQMSRASLRLGLGNFRL